MPHVDFVPDVDGFAFANQWTFDEREKKEIRDIVREAMPIAAAALTPIVMGVSPVIAPVAGLALGPVLPLLSLAGPFLIAAAPKIAELIVTAVTDAIAKGGGKDNLCGGMTAAALDYHRLGWIPPRGKDFHANPQYGPSNPDSIESWLRKRIWEGQLESHLDNTPTVVLWKAIASVFGDWGHDWLRDRTREELWKIDNCLATGMAVPLGIVLKSMAIGHIVVVFGLEWHGPDHCTLSIYDNEVPDQTLFIDIDLTQSPIQIVRRRDGQAFADGVFLGKFRQKLPKPAIALSKALSVSLQRTWCRANRSMLPSSL
jgi:hypothetical protein